MIKDPRKIRATHRWRKLSLYMRRRYPLCYNPFNSHEVRPADEVHHIIPIRKFPEYAFTKENLVCLCRQCHDKVDSMNERGERTIHLFEKIITRGYKKSLVEKKSLPPPPISVYARDEIGGRGCKREKGEGKPVYCARLNKKKEFFCGNCEINKGT